MRNLLKLNIRGNIHEVFVHLAWNIPHRYLYLVKNGYKRTHPPTPPIQKKTIDIKLFICTFHGKKSQHKIYIKKVNNHYLQYVQGVNVYVLVRVSYFFLVGVPCFGSCFVSVFVSDLVAAGVLPVAPPFCAFWAAAFCLASFSSCPAPANIFTNSTKRPSFLAMEY